MSPSHRRTLRLWWPLWVRQAVRSSDGAVHDGSRSPIEALEPRTLLTAASVYSFDFGQGFNGDGMSLNNSASYAGTALRLTDGGTNETRSAFYAARVPITKFQTDFAIQLTNAVADGMTFTIQASSTSALGIGGGGLGYQAISKSAAVKFDLYNNAGEGSDSTGLYTNGATPTSSGSIDLTPTGIDLHSGDVIDVHIAYDGATLTVNEVDATKQASATQTYSVNLQQVVGGTSAWIGFTGGTSASAATQQVLRWTYNDNTGAPSVGLNLSWPADLFADAAKTGRWDIQHPAVDANGWPTQDAFFYPATLTPGTYAMQFNGKASVGSSNGAATVQNYSYDATTNTSTASLVVTQTLAQYACTLHFSNTQATSTSATNTGITNLQLMKPVSPGSGTSYAFGTVFEPNVLTLAEKFKVIRYMDALATNGSITQNWSDRTTPAYATQTKYISGSPWQGQGVAWEYLVAFANATNTDMWINVPELASADYVTKLADLLRYGSDGVNPYTTTQSSPVWAPLNWGLKVYVEYSNEVWNPGSAFTQDTQNKNAARDAVTNNTSEGQIINYDGVAGALGTNGYYANQSTLDNRYLALKVKETNDAFRTVFGSTAIGSRVRSVYEWYYGGSGNGNGEGNGAQGMAFLNNYFNNGDGQTHVASPHPVSYYIWGGGGGWYDTSSNASGSNDVLVTNGSFESGTTGWTFSGPAGVTANGSSLGNPNAPDGTNAAYLQNGGSVSQQLTFSGGYADVFFESAHDASGNGTFDVYYDGTDVGTIKPGSTYAWIHSPAFLTTAGTHTITLTANGTGNAFVDRVYVGTANGIFNSGITGVGSVANDAKYAHAYGLHDAGYEGDWNLGGDTGQTPLQVQATLDPRATQATVSTLNQFFADGGELAMHFNSQGGSYGLTPDMVNLNTPKIQAIDQVNAEVQPAVANGTAPPTTTTINANIYAPGSGTSAYGQFLNVTTGGYFDVSASLDPTKPTTVRLAVDGTTVSVLTVASGSSTITARTWLAPGLHYVQLADIAAAGSAAGYVYSLSTQVTGFTNLYNVNVPGKNGTAVSEGVNVSVGGSGSGIGGTSDQFSMLSRTKTGDGSIVAELTGFTGTAAGAKAGIMFRDSASYNAMTAAVFVTPSGGVQFLYRTYNGNTAGAVNVSGIGAPTPAAPLWVKLTRTGNAFAGYYSTDGVAWTQIGTSVTIAMNSTAMAGLAVTSGDNTLLATAAFSDVLLN